MRVALVLLALTARAEAQQHVWSELFDNRLGHDAADVVTTDSSGNILVAGEFTDELILGNTTLDSQGSVDTFIVKLNPNGDPLWVADIGGVGPDEPAAIVVDTAGNVYVAGKFSGTTDFGGTQVTSRGRSDIFVASYAAGNGLLRWVRGFGSVSTDVAGDLAINAANELVLAGSFQDSIDFGGGPLTSAGSYDLALVGLTSQNGAHRWSTRFGKQFGDQAAGVALDGQGRVFLTGYFDSQTDVGTGTLVTNGTTDSFIAGYNAQNGQPLWARKIGGTGFDVSRDVAVTPDGKVVVIGYYGLSGGAVDFGGGPIGTNGGADAFLAAYNGSNGAPAWSRGLGGPADDHLRSIFADTAGNLSLAGYFQIETNVGGGPLPSNGQLEIVLARYTSAGAHVWSKSYGGILGDQALGVTGDPAGNMISVGFIGFDVDFGGGTLYAQAWTAPFVVKLAFDGVPPPPTSPPPTRTPTPTRTPPPTATRTPTAVAGSLTVSGRVTYYSNLAPVPGVTVTLTGPQGRTTQTNTNGNYSFVNLTSSNVTIEPRKANDQGTAVSGLDAAYVLQAVTGLRAFSDDQILACDVTGNGDLSSLDAAKILQYLVGTTELLPVADGCDSDWLFAPSAVPAAGQVLQAPVVSSGECRHGRILFNPLSASAQGQSFNAILFGDCTGNWTYDSGVARQALSVDAPQLLAGRVRPTRCGKLAVPVFVRGNSFNAAQVTLRYDAEAMTPVGARPAGKDGRDILVHYSVARPGTVHIALASARPLDEGRALYIDFEPTTEPATPRPVTVAGGTVDERLAHATGTLSRR